MVHIGHANALCLLGDSFLCLLLGANEEDGSAVCNGFLDEVEGDIDIGNGLLEVDDVDAVTFGEDETLHLRVPTTGLVPEVHARFQKLAHGDDCHCIVLSPLSGIVGFPPVFSVNVPFRPWCYDVATHWTVTQLPRHFHFREVLGK